MWPYDKCISNEATIDFIGELAQLCNNEGIACLSIQSSEELAISLARRLGLNPKDDARVIEVEAIDASQASPRSMKVPEKETDSKDKKKENGV